MMQAFLLFLSVLTGGGCNVNKTDELSKQKAYNLFDSGEINKIEAGTVKEKGNVILD